MKARSFDKIFEFIKKYRWNSIFVIQLKRTALIILIPVILAGGLLVYYQNKISVNSTQAHLTESFSSSCNIMKNTIRNLNNQKQIISIDKNIKILMTLDNPTNNTETVNSVLQSTKQNLSNAMLSINNIDSISLFSIQSNTVFSTKKSGNIENLNNPAWYKEFQKTNNPNFIIKYTDDESKSEYLTVSYGYYVNSKLCGLMIFDLNINDFVKAAFDTNKNTCLKLMLYTPDGTIYYDYQKEPGQSYDISYFLKSEKYVMRNGRTLFLKSECEELGLMIAAVNSPDSVTTDSHSMFMYFFLIILILFMMTVILSMYLSFQFYDTIAKIMSKINEYDTDSIKYENELTYITQNISSYFFKTQEIEEQLALNFCELKKAQNLALQTQFNPHFIFNVLNLINVKVIKYAKDGNNEASRIIALLSVLLRSAINPKEYVVTVAEELDYAKKYIEIEAICLNNSFDIFIEAEPKANSCLTVKFILQPIIENAFQHGIKLLEDKRGYIKIRTFFNKDELVFEIINNSPILSEEQIQKAIDSLNNGTEASGTHIGLYNVNQRIKLIFGEKYGCSFLSENGITTVTVVLPATKNKDLS